MVNCFLSKTSQRILVSLRRETGNLQAATRTHLFSLLPLPVSLKPLAKGLLSIFNCVIWWKLKNGHFILPQLLSGQCVSEGRVWV